jgi:hypothetical protein
MEWLIFTYWLPAEPSRKRVSVWRQLKKLGAISAEGSGWLLPKTEPTLANLTGMIQSVEEMEGTANLFIATHFSDAQEQRTITRFHQEREKEYTEITYECHKTLKHIERETHACRFHYEEVEELEGDVEKIERWFSDVNQRSFWEVPESNEVDKLLGEVRDKLAEFVQKTYETQQESQKDADGR